MESSREQSRQSAPMYSDDDLMTILQELHIPDNVEDIIEIHRLLSLVEDLVNLPTETIGPRKEDASFENYAIQYIRKLVKDDACGQTMTRVSCQATSEILKGNDAHTITIGLLKYLSNLDWEEKLMLTLNVKQI